MGRFRNTARFIFSIGGTDGISPIAKESERTALLREQNQLIAEQTRRLAPPRRSADGVRRCPSCREPIQDTTDASVPFAHTATGVWECHPKRR